MTGNIISLVLGETDSMHILGAKRGPGKPVASCADCYGIYTERGVSLMGTFHWDSTVLWSLSSVLITKNRMQDQAMGIALWHRGLSTDTGEEAGVTVLLLSEELQANHLHSPILFSSKLKLTIHLGFALF